MPFHPENTRHAENVLFLLCWVVAGEEKFARHTYNNGEKHAASKQCYKKKPCHTAADLVTAFINLPMPAQHAARCGEMLLSTATACCMFIERE